MLFHVKYQSNSPEQAGVPRRGRRPLPAGSDRSAAPGWACSGNAVARPCAPVASALRGSARDCVCRASRQPTRRPSRPRSRTSCFSSQGQRTIKGAGELLTGSKRGRRRHRLSLPRVSRMSCPPRPPAHGAKPPPGRARATSTAAAAAEPRASWARPLRALRPRAPAFAHGLPARPEPSGTPG